MLTSQDKSSVLRQIGDLKLHNEKMKDHLNAIQLLMVDDNNSRLKDESFANELENLTKSIDSVESSIGSMEGKLI